MSLLRRLFGRPGGRKPAVSEEAWQRAIEQHPICNRLSAEQREALRLRTGEVLSRLDIETVRGLSDSPELRLSVALQAALPILELGVGWYRAVRSILLVPEEYETDLTTVDEAGVVHESTDTISGEVGHQLPVVLSVADVEASGWGDGYNVVIHEMAHVLDATNGELDGEPALPTGVDPARWREAFSKARSEHLRRVRRAERGGSKARTTVNPPVIDPYGAEGPEEFFACSAEVFFERPRRLKRAYPELYEQLCAFFGYC